MIKKFLNRYFIQAMSTMALGLFASLIINLIISQIAKIPGLGYLQSLADVFGAASPVTGCAIGVAIAWGLQAKPLVMFSSAASGACGYAFGGPVGAYLAGVVGAEIGSLVASKTKVDIVVTPLVTIIAGGSIALLVGPYIQSFMVNLGNIINVATEMSPIPMGIIVAVLVGMALTAPISSAAICIMLNLSGLAAGAAAVGCCAQMVGFAVAGYKDNGIGGLISVGLGTSMLQFANIMRRPQIWIAPTLAGAILGPISTKVFAMQNIASGAGMGTSGLVGQFGAYAAMSATTNAPVVLLEILIMHFIAPAILVLSINYFFKKIKWIKPGDMKIKNI